MAAPDPWLELYEAADGWRWRLFTRNGKLVAESGEAYHSRAACSEGWSRVFEVVSEAYVTGRVLERKEAYRRALEHEEPEAT